MSWLEHDRERLMNAFDSAAALDQVTKERIRHRIWARLSERQVQPRSFDAEMYVEMGGILVGLLSAPALGILWSVGYSAVSRLGSLALAIPSRFALYLISPIGD